MVAYLDIVNIMRLSVVFENNLLTAYEVVPVVQETIAQLETLSEDESVDELSQESFLHMFKIKDEDDLITVITNYPKAGHEHRDKVNREYV